MKKLYRYREGIVALEDQEIPSIIEALEQKCRKGNVKYVPSGGSLELLEDIKKKWPEDAKAFLRDMLKDLKEKGGKVGSQDIAHSVKSMLIDRARKRAQDRANDRNLPNILKYEIKMAVAEFALSCMLGVAPSLDAPGPKELGGASVAMQISAQQVRLVVDRGKTEEADVFLLGLYDELSQTVRFAGWAGQSDVKAATFDGDRSAYCVEYEDLRGMESLLERWKIDSVPERVLFESVPKKGDFPAPSRLKPMKEQEEPVKFASFLYDEDEGGSEAEVSEQVAPPSVKEDEPKPAEEVSANEAPVNNDDIDLGF